MPSPPLMSALVEAAAVRVHRRLFSAAAAGGGSRLAALRETLRLEDAEVTSTSASVSASASASVSAPASAPASTLGLASMSATATAPPKRRRKEHVRHPEWLKVQMPGGENYTRLKRTLKASKLATVCQEARCPNIGECWGGKEGTATATIMVMGDTCTRGCRFCNIKTAANPPPLDPGEAEATAEQIASWGVGYVVITSVDRDDLPDGGASHFADVVRITKERRPSLLIECLTPDFNNTSGLDGVALVARSGLEVYAHNIETVERLQRNVRDHRAGYASSLRVLEHAKEAQPKVVTKTSIMLGVGEEQHEIRQAMLDCLQAGVEIFTLGQYMRPSKRHMPVTRMVPPEEFDFWKAEGERLGFKYVFSGPLVRSSYKAGEAYIEGFLKGRVPQSADNSLAGPSVTVTASASAAPTA